MLVHLYVFLIFSNLAPPPTPSPSLSPLTHLPCRSPLSAS